MEVMVVAMDVMVVAVEVMVVAMKVMAVAMEVMMVTMKVMVAATRVMVRAMGVLEAGEGAGMGGGWKVIEGAEGEGEGYMVGGKTATLIILSLAREAEEVVGAEAVAADALS